MKQEHRGLTLNEILHFENVDKEYTGLINQNKVDEAVDLLIRIGFESKEAKAQVLENINSSSSILNFFKAVFHGLTNYRFQK
jgi:hypothetical protein